MITKAKILTILTILITLFLLSCNKDNYNATIINFSSGKITIKNNNDVKIDDNKIYITKNGSYTFAGEGKDVQIVIDCDEDVKIILDNVTINNQDITPIKIVSSGIVYVECIGKSVSTIRVTSNDKKNSCINSEGALDIKGDTLFQLEGHDCIDIDNELTLSGNIEIFSTGDAIKAEKVTLSSSSLVINTKKDAIQAQEIEILSGNYVINGASDKSRGLYSKGNININACNISIVTTDDGIYAKDTIVINDGMLSIKTQDDAIHADKEVEINGGNILIEECLEGIESGLISINNGKIDIISSNDGVNGAQSDKDSNESADIYINGGETNINASGDGLDANGSIYIDDGVLFISGAHGGNNNAIDFDDELIINGGTIIAAGNNLKAKPPSLKSMQNTIMIIYGKNQSSSKNIILYDESNNALIVANMFKDFDSLIVSSPNIKSNTNYTIGETILDNLKDSYLININVENNSIITHNQFNISSKITFVWIK